MNDPRPEGRRSRIDSYFDDHTPWSWLDLAAGVVIGIAFGVIGSAGIVRELAMHLAACRG